jgi:prepilin-type N-terminal cleavage/methylation domain-containing protein
MNRSGLTLIEVVVAMVVMTIGILGLAAGTGWMIRSVGLTQMDTDRAAALQATVESVRGRAFDQVSAGSTSQGEYSVSWSVASATSNSKVLEFVIVGPGRVGGSMGPRAVIGTSLADTLEYRVIRP